MATATKDEIKEWKREGKDKKATHLIVVCDTFSHEDYPVYVGFNESLADVKAGYDNVNMQRIMEVIDL